MGDFSDFEVYQPDHPDPPGFFLDLGIGVFLFVCDGILSVAEYNKSWMGVGIVVVVVVVVVFVVGVVFVFVVVVVVVVDVVDISAME